MKPASDSANHSAMLHLSAMLHAISPMLHLILAAVVLLGYAAALCWMLRHETPAVLLGLAAICGVSLALRLVYTGDYPPGFDLDEVDKFRGGVLAIKYNDLLGRDFSGWPVLLNALFEAPLAVIFGPNRWAIRTYSLVTSVLSTPAAFAALRAFGMEVAPSLLAGSLIAVLPWSIFYGRVSSGGELVFHELLVVAALGRLLSSAGGWPEMIIGAFGLSALLYDYGCGRVILVLPLVAAVLARAWRARFLCVAILVLALVAWIPLLVHNPQWLLFTSAAHVRPEAYQNPLQTWMTGMAAGLRALWSPTAQDMWLTVRHAAMHPVTVLVLAAAGILLPSRLSVFLLAGFLLGLGPVTITDNGQPSTHRMLMAFPFIALAASRAVNFVRSQWAQRAVAVAVVVLVGTQSVQLYFSREFWPEASRTRFNPEASALFEAMPPNPPFRPVIMQQLNTRLAPRFAAGESFELLSIENWFPRDNGAWMYGFSAHAPLLRSFYENLLGSQRVQSFGRAFAVTLEPGDWSWMRQHGWAYEARCGGDDLHAQVPALFHLYLHPGLHCQESARATHIWRGHWNGPEALLRLFFSGDAVVDTPTGRAFEKEGFETYADFTVQPGTDLRVEVTSGPAVTAFLFEMTPAGARVPTWQSVTPDWSACMSDSADGSP